MSEVNPRYVAYAKAHGKTVDEMRAHDEVAWPGGRMAGFILWMSERWQAWDRLHKQGRDHVRSAHEHNDFDAWLMA